jgi:hypothetical protein
MAKAAVAETVKIVHVAVVVAAEVAEAEVVAVAAAEMAAEETATELPQEFINKTTKRQRNSAGVFHARPIAKHCISHCKALHCRSNATVHELPKSAPHR